MHRHLTVDSIDRLVAAAQPETVHTGAMVALIPNEDDARRLLVAGYEPLEELHVTLAFLGEADVWDENTRAVITGKIAGVAKQVGPVVGKVWATAHFNPIGEHPAAVYLIGGVRLDVVHRQIWNALPDVAADNHAPWVPHLTIGYGLDPARLTEAGRMDITFDRIRVVFGDDATDLSLA